MVSEFREWLGHHPVLVALMFMVYGYGALMSFMTPELVPTSFWAGLEGSHTQIMLAVTAMTYLGITAFYLIYKGRKYYSDRGLRENVPMIWGTSFLAYIVTYIGIILNASDIITMNAELFFFFRSSMILWAAGIAYGLITLRTSREGLRNYIPLSIAGLSLAWFAWGLFNVGSIEYTMYGFTSFIWVPLTFAFGYFFWTYSGGTGHSGMKWISAGMVYMGSTYLFWAPTHQNFLYEVAFFQYNIAASIILLGMTKLPWKEMSDVERPLDLIFEEDHEN